LLFNHREGRWLSSVAKTRWLLKKYFTRIFKIHIYGLSVADSPIPSHPGAVDWKKDYRVSQGAASAN
jgi:hypothetical protein